MIHNFPTFGESFHPIDETIGGPGPSSHALPRAAQNSVRLQAIGAAIRVSHLSLPLPLARASSLARTRRARTRSIFRIPLPALIPLNTHSPAIPVP